MSLSQATTNGVSHLSVSEHAWVNIVLEKVRLLHHGTVHIKVHEAQVVLVESTELTRFDLPPKARGN